MMAQAVTREALEQARQELDAYLANPANVAGEAQLRGRRIRVTTIVACASAGALCAGAAVMAVAGVEVYPVVALIVGAVFALVAVAALVLDLRVPRRDRPGTPEDCLKGYLTAIRFSRSGYGVTCLGPAARARVVPSPNLAPALTSPGTFTLDSPASLKAYAKTFAIQGHGQMHLFQAKKVTVLSSDGPFAQVEAQVAAYSWPQWVTYLGIGLLVALRLVGAVVYLALYYSMRKGGSRVVRKWAIRGSDGVYYLFDGDVVGP